MKASGREKASVSPRIRFALRRGGERNLRQRKGNATNMPRWKLAPPPPYMPDGANVDRGLP